MLEDDVPKHIKKATRRKPFGIESKLTFLSMQTHWRCGHWYATEKARDIAFDALTKKNDTLNQNHKIAYRKIDR